MSDLNLTKAEKKLAREIIEKGLQREFVSGLKESAEIIKQWEQNNLDNRDAYGKLYHHVRNYDKHISLRYNYVTGSKYLNVIAVQMKDGIIVPEEIEGFQPENREILMRWSGLLE